MQIIIFEYETQKGNAICGWKGWVSQVICLLRAPSKISKMSSLFSQAKEEKVHGRNRLPESAGALPRGCGKTSASQVRG